jgi:hypothetical protein
MGLIVGACLMALFAMAIRTAWQRRRKSGSDGSDYAAGASGYDGDCEAGE